MHVDLLIYLITLGIDKHRNICPTHGYGETKILDACKTSVICVKRKDTLRKGQFAAGNEYEQQYRVCDMYVGAASVMKNKQASLWNSYSFVVYELIAYPLGIKTLQKPLHMDGHPSDE
jgi:hypothetical protein